MWLVSDRLNNSMASVIGVRILADSQANCGRLRDFSVGGQRLILDTKALMQHVGYPMESLEPKRSPSPDNLK